MGLLLRRAVALLLACLIPVAAVLTVIALVVMGVVWCLSRAMGVRP